MKTNIQFLPYLPHFSLELEMLQTKVVEKIKKHTFCVQYLFFSFENSAVYENMW
jgi:hypothetical protein